MKSLITFLLFTTIVFHSQGQSTTFFKSDQINFQNKKFRLFGHEDIEQNKERIEILSRTYLGDKNPASLMRTSKLKLNDNNDQFFSRYIMINYF